MTCPNDTDHDGDCHLCHRLPTGCFLRDTARSGNDECRRTNNEVETSPSLQVSPSPSLQVSIKP
jgi:hypothetical protein